LLVGGFFGSPRSFILDLRCPLEGSPSTSPSPFVGFSEPEKGGVLFGSCLVLGGAEQATGLTNAPLLFSVTATSFTAFRSEIGKVYSPLLLPFGSPLFKNQNFTSSLTFYPKSTPLPPLKGRFFLILFVRSMEIFPNGKLTPRFFFPLKS